MFDLELHFKHPKDEPLIGSHLYPVLQFNFTSSTKKIMMCIQCDDKHWFTTLYVRYTTALQRLNRVKSFEWTTERRKHG